MKNLTPVNVEIKEKVTVSQSFPPDFRAEFQSTFLKKPRGVKK